MCSEICPLTLCNEDPGYNENSLKLFICGIVVFGPLNSELMKERCYMESTRSGAYTSLREVLARKK